MGRWNENSKSEKPSIRIVAGVLAFALSSNFAHAELIPSSLSACHSLLNEAVEAADAIPFTRKIMDATLSKKWHDSFDPALYRRMKDQYVAAENMGLEQWGFAESELAYLSALIEKATGIKISLPDVFIDDPSHARELQLLCKGLDFSKPLTRFQLENALERAFMLTGKLDVHLSDLRHMNSDRIKVVMKEYIWKDMAKEGVVKVYADMGLLVYTKKEAEELVAKMIKDGKVATVEEGMKELQVESRIRKYKRYYEHPGVQAALLVPTWHPLAPGEIVQTLRPGVVPEVRWVRFKKEELALCMEVGIDKCLESLEPKLRTMLRVQRSYEFFRHVTAIWAGTLTFAYAYGQLFHKSPQDVQNWVATQFTSATNALQKEFDQDPANAHMPPLDP
jgi:hypothetical protein